MKSISIIALLITGCATTFPQDPIVTTKIVEVPVVAKCEVVFPRKPTSTLLSVPVGASAYDKYVAALEELEALRTYRKELEIILEKCANNLAP